MNAIWYQPASLFPRWRAASIDTLVGCPGGAAGEADPGVNGDAWCKAADKAGLSYVLQSDGGMDAHYGDARCVGIQLAPDEPNSGAGAPNRRTPGQVLDIALAIRAKTSKPLWISFSGWNLLWETDSEIAAYCASVDVVAFDYYVINRGETPAAIPKLGLILDKLARLAPGKQLVLAVECSHQHLERSAWLKSLPAQAALARGPTPGEMADEDDQGRRFKAWRLWFPQIIGANWEAHDGTTESQYVAMTILNRK